MYTTPVEQRDDLQRIRIPEEGIEVVIKVVRVERLMEARKYGEGNRKNSLINPSNSSNLLPSIKDWFRPLYTTPVEKRDDLQTGEQRICIPDEGLAVVINVVSVEKFMEAGKYGGGKRYH